MKTSTISEEVLFFLYRNHYFKNATFPFRTFVEKYPPFLANTLKKELNRLNELHLISFKKTNHGLDVFLNVSRKKEIENIISDKLDSLHSI